MFNKQATDISVIGPLNDLWKYRMNDSTWIWVAGSNTSSQPGVYGPLGDASTEYLPSARYGAIGWFDSLREELWLFGGLGFGNDSSQYGACVVIGKCSTNTPLKSLQ